MNVDADDVGIELAHQKVLATAHTEGETAGCFADAQFQVVVTLLWPAISHDLYKTGYFLGDS
jgi:hypothetical protein